VRGGRVALPANDHVPVPQSILGHRVGPFRAGELNVAGSTNDRDTIGLKSSSSFLSRWMDRRARFVTVDEAGVRRKIEVTVFGSSQAASRANTSGIAGQGLPVAGSSVVSLYPRRSATRPHAPQFIIDTDIV
jgi:hypothetical protein